MAKEATTIVDKRRNEIIRRVREATGLTDEALQTVIKVLENLPVVDLGLIFRLPNAEIATAEAAGDVVEGKGDSGIV